MNKQLAISLAVWCALLALPFALRTREPGRADTPTETLVIISAHNKSVRDEYSRAFGEYYYKKHGRRIEIDFRNLGGTSDIVRYIADRFEAEFRHYYEKRHPGKWSRDIANAFANPATLDDPAASAELKQARREFLASDVGITPTNDGFTHGSGANSNWQTRGFLLLRQRLGMPGRTISANLDWNLSNNKMLSYNQSLTNVYVGDLINTTLVEGLLTAGTACVGVFLIGTAVEGYIYTFMPAWLRIVAAIGALLLMKPGLETDIIGSAVLALVLFLQKKRQKSEKSKA